MVMRKILILLVLVIMPFAYMVAQQTTYKIELSYAITNTSNTGSRFFTSRPYNATNSPLGSPLIEVDFFGPGTKTRTVDDVFTYSQPITNFQYFSSGDPSCEPFGGGPQFASFSGSQCTFVNIGFSSCLNVQPTAFPNLNKIFPIENFSELNTGSGNIDDCNGKDITLGTFCRFRYRLYAVYQGSEIDILPYDEHDRIINITRTGSLVQIPYGQPFSLQVEYVNNPTKPSDTSSLLTGQTFVPCPPRLDGTVNPNPAPIAPTCVGDSDGGFDVTFDRVLRADEKMTISVHPGTTDPSVIEARQNLVASNFTGRTYKFLGTLLPAGSYRMSYVVGPIISNAFPSVDGTDGFFTITNPPALNYLTDSVIDATCSENGEINITPSGGSGNFKYQWTGPDGSATIVSTSQNLNTSVPGDYILKLFDANVTDDSCFIDSPSINIGAPPAKPEITLINLIQPSSANGGRGAIEISVNRTEPVTYEWKKDDAIFTPADNENLVNLDSGTYTLQVTDEDGCISDIETIIIDPLPALSVAISQNDFIYCDGETTTLTANGAGGAGSYTYAWSTGEIGEFITAGPGMYSVTITDADTSSATSDSFTVNYVNRNNTSTIITNILSVAVTNTTDVLCRGENTGRITLDITGGLAPYEVFWDGSFTPGLADNTTLSTGNHSYEVFDSNDCSVLGGPIFIGEPIDNPEITVDLQSDVTTNGGSDGRITVSIQGGTPPYTYAWKKDDIDFTTASDTDLTNLTVGIYELTVKDNNGVTNSCEIIETIIIDQPGPLQINNPAATVTDVLCFGESTGRIDASYEGNPPFEFVWFDEADIELKRSPEDFIENLSTGIYSYTINDASNAGPIPSGDIEITQPTAALEATFDQTEITCFGGNDGTITVNATGGTAPLQYQISGGAALQITLGSFTNLEAGTYTIDIIDANGCSINTPLTAILDPAPQITFEDNNAVIPVSTPGGSDGSVSVTVQGGAQPYFYRWSGPVALTPINTANTSTIENLPEGVYTLEVSNKATFDIDGCYFTRSYTVTEEQAFSIQPLTGADTCNNQDSGTITATVEGTGNIIFEFLRNPGPTETIEFTTTTAIRSVTATDLQTGTYGLRITEETSTNTITTEAANYFTIQELEPITATVAPTDLNCNETNTGIITITDATGGSNTDFEYAIDNGLFQTNNIFNNLAPKTYAVTVRDDLGCEFNTTVDVVQTGAPIVDQPATVVNNASSTTSLDGAIILEFENTDITSYTYEWSGPGVTGRVTKDLDDIGAGNYQVIVTAPGNCTLTVPFTVGVTDTFAIESFTGTDSCFNQSTGSLTATIQATGSVTFNWFEIGDPVTPFATETTNLRTLSTQGLGVGTYYLEIVNSDNVTLRSDINVEIVQLAEVSATVVPVATCPGQDSGSILFSAPQGSASSSYSYSIDGGVTFVPNPLFEDLEADTYTVHMRAAENPNCDFILPGVTVTTSPQLFWDEPNTTITRASGPEANDGTIAPVFTGGTAPFTYLWSTNANSATTQNITALVAGNYTVIVTDAAECSITQNFEVTEVGPLTISNIVPTDASCRGEANGSITTTVTGEGTIIFLWTLENGDAVPVSNGVTGQNITGISAGSYILTATDNNTTVSTAVIAIGEPITTLTITNITPTDVSCFGSNDGTLEIQAAGGSGPYTYSLNGGAFQTSPIFKGLLATSYTVRVQDANSCEFLEPTPILVLEPQELNLIINEQRPVTAANKINGAIFITVEGGSDTYSYEWSGPNGFTSTDEDISNLAAGNYSVTITDPNFAISNGAGCRLISAPIAITEPGQLIADLTQTVPLECSGDDFAEITANVQGGVLPYAYQWFQISNGNNTLLDEDTDIIGNLSTGNYFVRATDSNSITIESNPINITEPTQLEIIVDNTTNVICASQPTGSINITVSGGTPPYQYFWSNSATVADISGLDAGDYTIDVEDAAGCISQNTITITAPDDTIQIADATKDNVSAYQALDGSISLDISGGLTPYTYVWTRLSDNSNAGDQATILNLSADSYTVFISDASGCTVTETYEITQPDIVEDTIVQPSCSGEADGRITVSVNQGNGSFTYLWNTGTTENNIDNLAAGTYTVTVTGFENGPLTRSYILENPVPLEVNLGADRVLCADQILELDATVDDETANYSWISDTGFTSSAPNIVITQTGNYTVSVQSQTGCTAQGTIFVDISTDEINAEFAMSSQVFAGETAVAVDISYPLPEGVEWVVPIGAEVVTQNSDEAQFSFAEAGEYEIGIITTRGDCIAQKTKKIIVVAPDGAIAEEDTQSGKKLISDFMVYPNPSSGKFTADVNLTEKGSISIKVFSFANNAMMASKKDRGELSYSIPFDLTGLPVGVYAVLLETPYGNTLRKVILK